jgi:hypothetical protein
MIGSAIIFVGMALWVTLKRFESVKYHLLAVVAFVCGCIIVAHGANLFLDAEIASASPGAYCVSAQPYSRAEDIGVVPIVIPKFEFCDVQWQTFTTDFVKTAHNAALQERPETVDSLSVDNAVNVLPGSVADGLMLLKPLVSAVFIGGDQTDFVRNRFANETIQGFHIGVFDDAGNERSLALDRADDRGLSGTASSGSALIPMAVFVLSADVGFVNFNNAHELAEVWICEASANTVAEIEGGRIGAGPHHSMDLKGGNSLLAGQHQIDDLEPSLKLDLRVVKDGFGCDGKLIPASFGAFRALPTEALVGDGVNVFVPAARATDAIGPAARDKIVSASVVGREQLLELANRHLSGEFRAWHRSDSLV